MAAQEVGPDELGEGLVRLGVAARADQLARSLVAALERLGVRGRFTEAFDMALDKYGWCGRFELGDDALPVPELGK